MDNFKINSWCNQSFLSIIANNSILEFAVKSFHVWIFKTMSFYIFQSAESKARATWQCVFIGMCYSIVFTSVFVRKYFSPRVTRVHKRSLAWDNVVDSHADPWNFIYLEWFADYRNSGNDERFTNFPRLAHAI